MKYLKAVCIGAIAIAVATVVFVELRKDGAPERPSTNQQAVSASDVSSAPSNPQNDPYKENLAQAISAVRNAYFAAGCKVFTSDEEVLPLVSQELSALNDEAKAQGITEERLEEELTAAGQDGAAQAQQPGACDYWQQHSDAVLAVRRAVREAAEP